MKRLTALTILACLAMATSVHAAQYPLYAGQNIEIGFVKVWHNANGLRVIYRITDEAWILVDTKLAVATNLNGIPRNKPGNPIPGQFPYTEPNGGGVISDTRHPYLIPWSAICNGGSPCDVVIAAHADVQKLGDPVTECVVSSTTSATLESGTPAVEAWQPFDPDNDYWDNNINYSFPDEAKWIWSSYRTSQPISGEIVAFETIFNIASACITSGQLRITADNGYEVNINGNFVGDAQVYGDWKTSNFTQAFVDVDGWQSVETWDVTGFLQGGANTMSIVAANEYMGPLDGQSNGTVDSNPAGLIFELCYTCRAVRKEETAWGYGPRFVPKGNWATYIQYTVE
ncbi:alpha-L-rhamnosidase N-terminal domain-containing protein [Anaerobaca lacustris]|uniref:Alpha-L-rhamnosidase N-terminal domain-containing protein n=1 Tax=Anaerobaca lacustris TaxID=3044600 RepID=A0AAW6U2Y2_9BACT|nr:alpha-L-rhamnosidase N-terminal domain-containing protein [Sedimentisphaerales bacterium M17dextr]